MTTPIPVWGEQIAALRFLAHRVARVHGPTHSDAVTLAEVVNALADTPIIDRAAQIVLGRRLRELTEDFQPWAGSCGSVCQLYAGLASVASALPHTHESSTH